MSAVPPRRAALVFIYITAVLDWLAFGLVIPVLPKLIEGFLGGDTARAAEVYGVFGTAWALMQFVFSPVLGALSDRFGRRPVILLSNFGLGLDYVLMALAPTLSWLFVGRIVSGITSASFTSASAYIADVAEPEKRAQGFGMIGAAFGFGFVVGPATGGVLGDIDPHLPFWVAAGLSIANGFYGLFVLPESLPPERRIAFSLRNANPLGALGLLRSQPLLFGLAGVALLHNLAHDVQPHVFVFYTTHRYGWSQATVGLTLAVVGITGIVVSAGLVGPIVARLGERRALLAGLAFGALGFAIYGFAPTPSWFWAGVPATALWGIYGPAAQSLMTRQASASEQGRLQGALNGLRGLTGLATPALYTLTFAHFLDTLPGAPFLLASSLLVSAMALAAWVTRTRA
jgi:DHA1 family tetracycline resistance protein-like MFS transporter